MEELCLEKSMKNVLFFTGGVFTAFKTFANTISQVKVGAPTI